MQFIVQSNLTCMSVDTLETMTKFVLGEVSMFGRVTMQSWYGAGTNDDQVSVSGEVSACSFLNHGFGFPWDNTMCLIYLARLV